MCIIVSSKQCSLLSRTAIVTLFVAFASGCSSDSTRLSYSSLFDNANNADPVVTGSIGSGGGHSSVGYRGASPRLPQASSPQRVNPPHYQRSSYKPLHYNSTPMRVANQPLPATDQSGMSSFPPAPVLSPRATYQPMPASIADQQVATERPNALLEVFKRASFSRARPPARAAKVVSSSKAGWTAVGGTNVRLSQGDTLYTVSRRFGVPLRALMRVNNISDPAQVRAGQNILIPTYVYANNNPISAPDVTKPKLWKGDDSIITGSINRASRSHMGGRAVVATPRLRPHTVRGTVAKPVRDKIVQFDQKSGIYHTVQLGETLGGIATRYGFDSSRDLLYVNKIDNPQTIRIGQRLFIPASISHVRSAQASQRVSKNEPSAKGNTAFSGQMLTKQPLAKQPNVKIASLPMPRPQHMQRSVVAAHVRTHKSKGKTAPDGPTHTAKHETGLPKRSEPQTTASINKDVRKSMETFRWPVRGRVISRFGTKANGQRNDGINLAVPEGASIKAAKNGTVVYAGNELKGYGNLVLVKHDNNWVSAYAHNSEVLVKRGDQVRRGQIIARAGKTGSVATPQLHFELRKGAKPVDPTPYLGT